MNAHEILAYFQDRQPAILNSIRELVEIESPSFNAGQSTMVAAWVENEARGIAPHLEIERIPAENCGEHVLIRAFHSDEKAVMLLGHTDTVHPIGTKAKNPTRIEGDKFYGCGIFDMKANVILMLEALRFFAEP